MLLVVLVLLYITSLLYSLLEELNTGLALLACDLEDRPVKIVILDLEEVVY